MGRPLNPTSSQGSGAIWFPSLTLRQLLLPTPCLVNLSASVSLATSTKLPFLLPFYMLILTEHLSDYLPFMNPLLSPGPNLLEFGGYIQSFGTIRVVLDDTLCSTQAALDLTSPIANSRDGELYLRTSQLWVAFISVVERIPVSHPWQDGIIHLLHEITKVPRPTRSDLHFVEDGYRGHFWDILPAFRFNVPGEFFKEPWERRPEVAAAEEERNTPRYTAIQ
jgi:hypothetical protein